MELAGTESGGRLATSRLGPTDWRLAWFPYSPLFTLVYHATFLLLCRSTIASHSSITSASSRTIASRMFSHYASRAHVVRYVLRNKYCSYAVGSRNFQAPTPTLCLQNQSLSARPFSEGIFDRLKGSMENREKRKQAEKYAEQMEKMANTEVWTLRNFLGEIEQSVPTGWRSKIPGVSNTQQAKQVEDAKNAVQSMLDEVGENATVQDLEEMGRKEKLKISLNTNVSVEDINILIKQFRGTEIMHKVLRAQKLSGKPIPTDEKGMKALFQAEASNVLSKSQKRSIQESQAKRGARGAGRMR